MNTIQHTSQSEEKVMDSKSNDDTINVSDLIKALQGMTGGVAETLATTTPKTEVVQHLNHLTKEFLTDSQVSFCELMALGSDRGDAYNTAYPKSDRRWTRNAARKLLQKEKIRSKIAEFRSQLSDMPTGFHEAETEDPTDVVRPLLGLEDAFSGRVGRDKAADGKPYILASTPTRSSVVADLANLSVRRGWDVRLTEKQEKFCQARAEGRNISDSYNIAGYKTTFMAPKQVRREGRRLLSLVKVKNRIADLVSGAAPDVEVAKQPRDNYDTKPQADSDQTPPFFNGRTQGAELNEFVDNFMELIKAHSRLFHHAVVIHGQKAAGLPVETAVYKMEDAVARSVATLKETLSKQLGLGGD